MYRVVPQKPHVALCDVVGRDVNRGFIHRICRMSDAVTEVPNIAPVHLLREPIASSQREIVKVLKRIADSVCRDKIPADYINRSFNAFKQGFLYRAPSGAIEGFCIWKRHKETWITGETRVVMYIYLICGRRQTTGFGNRLFPDIEEYCLAEQIDTVQLQPSNARLRAYYASHGFVVTDSVRDMMTKQFPAVLALRARAGKTRRAERRPRRNTVHEDELNVFAGF